MSMPLPDQLSPLPLDHIAIAVPELEAAARPYRLLGLLPGAPETVTDQGVRVCMLDSGAGRVELLEPLTEDSPVGRFLARRGPGLHHLGLRVESLDAEIERLASAGARFTEGGVRAGHGGNRIAFLHPGWTGGVLVELVEPAAVPHD